jgi:ribosomal protein S18 acetylase RimI-like enzyme
MVAVALEPASSRSHAELAALFTAGYEGYYMPVSIDEAAFSFMAGTWDYDLEGSLVATDAGGDVGLCMLAVRGEDAWIGGVGIVAGRRGEGIGEQLMRAAEENARARGVKRLWLEVLVQNEPAIGLYEKLGYERVRVLELWSLEEKLVFQKHKVPSVPVADVIGRSDARPPWQRANATVSNLADAHALADGHGSVIYRAAAGTASLLQVEADGEDTILQLLGSLPEDTTRLWYLNGPECDPLNAVLESLGGTQAARQHEMLLEL